MKSKNPKKKILLNFKMMKCNRLIPDKLYKTKVMSFVKFFRILMTRKLEKRDNLANKLIKS